MIHRPRTCALPTWQKLTPHHTYPHTACTHCVSNRRVEQEALSSADSFHKGGDKKKFFGLVKNSHGVQ